VAHALRLRMSESSSDFSTEVVPTSTGCLTSCRRAISSATAKYFSLEVRKTTSGFSRRRIGMLVERRRCRACRSCRTRRLGFGRAGHAGELFVHAEVVLEGDGGEGLVLLADGDALLCLDRLVESVGPAAAGHEAAGELVDDDDLALLDDVLDVALVEVVALMATSTWCLRSQFSGSAMLPMPRSFSIFSQPSS